MNLTMTQRRRIGTTVRYAVILIWVLFTLLPLYTAFVASLTKYENLGKNFLFPTDWEWKNYAEVFKRIEMGSYLKATFIYALSTAVINVVLAVFTGYALSRFRFRGKGFYSGVLLLTQVLPQVVIVVPVFLMLKKIGMYDSYFGVIIVVVATSMAFPTLLMKSFFDSVSIALEEAATIDGCTRLQALFRVVLPLALPGIGTAFGLSFFSGWGQYLYPMLLTRSAQYTPVTVGISRLIDNQTPWEMVMTGTIISIIPAVIIYLMVQKSLIKGMSAGAVK